MRNAYAQFLCSVSMLQFLCSVLVLSSCALFLRSVSMFKLLCLAQVKVALPCIQKDGAEDLPAESEVVMLVNNLGSTPVMEMYIAAPAALRYVQDKYKVSHGHCCMLIRGMTCSVS